MLELEYFDVAPCLCGGLHLCSAHLNEMLGRLEGVEVSILESGDFCLPDIARRPWLRDPEIGGVLKDLGTHALAPLGAAGMLFPPYDIFHPSDLCVTVNLAGISGDRTHLVQLTDKDEVEMYASFLLREYVWGAPVQCNIGKVPGSGGTWTLAVRYENGVYYAGLRTGQPSVLLFNDGSMIKFHLTVSPVEYLLQEAIWFFGGALRHLGLDGNMNVLLDALYILHHVREKFFMK